MDTSAIENLTDVIGVVISSALSWVSTVISAITDNALLAICVLIPFVSLGIALLKKLLTVKSE